MGSKTRFRASWLHRMEALRPFSEAEAWWLFKTTALSEAVGWTLLIIGVVIRQTNLPGSAWAVPVAGQIHGTIFLIYFAILLATYSSLRWSRKKFLLAAISGVPPYGTFVFELWAARVRRNQHSRVHFWSVVWHTISESLSATSPVDNRVQAVLN